MQRRIGLQVNEWLGAGELFNISRVLQYKDVSELRCRAWGILESVGLSLIQFDTCLELSRSELAKREKWVTRVGTGWLERMQLSLKHQSSLLHGDPVHISRSERFDSQRSTLRNSNGNIDDISRPLGSIFLHNSELGNTYREWKWYTIFKLQKCMTINLTLRIQFVSSEVPDDIMRQINAVWALRIQLFSVTIDVIEKNIPSQMGGNVGREWSAFLWQTELKCNLC